MAANAFIKVFAHIILGLASEIMNYMTSLSITIPTNTTVCDYFMFEISEYKKRTKNYTTKFNSLTYEEKTSKQIDGEIKEVKEASP